MPEIFDNRYLDTYQQQKINYFLLLNEKAPDLDYIWSVDSNNEVTLIYYYGHKSVVKVPSMVENYPVKYISPVCYDGLTFITSVIIPEGVTVIK